MLAEVRSRVEVQLQPFLGQYTLSNGAITPAMWVGFVDQPRAGTSVSGLEGVLDLGSLDVVRAYSAETSNARFTLHLLQWDGEQLDAAVTALHARWPGTRSQPVRVPEGWGSAAWVKAELLVKEVLNA